MLVQRQERPKRGKCQARSLAKAVCLCLAHSRHPAGLNEAAHRRPTSSHPHSLLGPLGHSSCCPLLTQRPNLFTQHWGHGGGSQVRLGTRGQTALTPPPKVPRLQLAGLLWPLLPLRP